MKNGSLKITVYKHTSKTSKKSYIGITTKTIKQRFSEHIGSSKGGSPFKFHKAIRKYGSDDFYSTILDFCTDLNAAKKLEIMYIKEFNTFKFGYNSTPGGDGMYIKTKETIQKQRNSLKERYKNKEITSPLADPKTHKKTMSTRKERNSNIFVTNNPMKNKEYINKKVEKTSGVNHYLFNKYKYIIQNKEEEIIELPLIGSLKTSLKQFNIKIATFNKHCNNNTSPSRGVNKGFKFFKYENN